MVWWATATLRVGEAHFGDQEGVSVQVISGASAGDAAVDPRHFEGAATLARLIGREDEGPARVYRVSFQAGARTHWHMHTGTQLLVIVDGRCQVQRWGGEPEVAECGDLVRFSPMETHRHGATSDGAMTHLAINIGFETEWLGPDGIAGTAGGFLERSRHYLSGDYLPKLRRCLASLSHDDVWWRPNQASNSVGNLILHLCGNARQWIMSGVGGGADLRQRDAEFSAEGGASSDDLVRHLDEHFAEIDSTLAALDPSTLEQVRTIQGIETTVLGAIYHVVEHVSTHTGQIIWITKARAGADLGFWAVEKGKARPNW